MKIVKTFENFLGDMVDNLPTRDTDNGAQPGPAGLEIDHEGHHESENYMFFGNLETIKRLVDIMLEMDPAKVDEVLRNGHNWAVDHVVSSKDDIEEVANFLINEMSEPERANEGRSYMCKECNSMYLEEDLSDSDVCESCGSQLEEVQD